MDTTSKKCIFCKIATGEIPTNKIYEDEDVLAFLSTGPVNLGHTLLIPKEHFETIYEMPDEVLVGIGIAMKKVSTAVKNGMGADGINIIMNNDRAAGQAIFHAHIHIIPRFSGDGFVHWEEGKKYKTGEAAEVAETIRSAFLAFS